MNRMILTFGGVLSASSLLLMDSAIKGTVLLALAAVAALILRRDSAATRHLVWMTAIVALLVVPVLSATLPQWRVLPNWMSSPRSSVAAIESVSPLALPMSAGEVIGLPQRAANVASMEVDQPVTPEMQPVTAAPVSRPALVTPEEMPASNVKNWSWMSAIPLVWAIGFVVLMLRLSAARWMLWNSERLAIVIGKQGASQRDPIVIAMTALCSQLKIRRPVTLLIHPHKTIPIVWGIFRCRLMLPVAARQWSDEQLKSVLMHELAHIKRRDTLVQLLTQVACALHWFNPLVWFAAWRLDVERERSCDDLVLASGIRPSAYAAYLLDVVSGLSPARWTQACGLAMARKSSLEGRLAAVLGKDLNRRSVSLTLAGLTLLIAVGLAVPIAMLRAADEEWNPPQVAHISSNDFSTYCVHDAKEAAYVIAYHGRSGSSSSGSSNSKSRTWNDNSTLTLLDTVEKRKLTLRRDHTAPNKLTLDGRDYDLAKGRIFLLSDNGSVRQIDIATPPVTAREDAESLAKLMAVTAPPTPMPIHKDARAFYEVWQRLARANGDIPGALVGELANAIKVFIGYNPTWETVPKLNEILPRLDATHDWKPADAIAVLDEVAGVQATLLEPAPWKGTRQTIRKGEALPKKYADASWGEEQPSGLRAAWLLEPNATEHRIGAAIKARLLVQNRGRVPVMLQVPTWRQGQVKATDAKGSEVQVSSIEWTTLALLHTVRLGPGEFIEINTPGVGVGPRAGMGPWAGPRVGSNVIAKAGDELTLTCSPVPLDGSEVGISQEDPHVSGPGWWLAHIKTRLNRELPLPADAAERTRILDRAVREFFSTAPTAEETAAFIADKTPEAIDALAKRLATRVGEVSFSGKLPTAPVKFRVLDATASADKQPRVVLGPGEYPLPCTTADRGQATLRIVGKPVGDRRTNEAQILFEATEATGKLPPDPHKLEVPDGWGTWAIVCRPSDGYFYLLHNGTVRKIDYSKPRNVTDLPVNDLPAEFRDEVKRQLDIHEISAAQQAEIFEKPARPAASLRSDAQVKPKPGAMIKLATEQKLKWGEPVNGLRMALAWPPVLGEPELGDKPEFYLVVQNVSEKSVRLTSNDTAPNPRMLDLYDTTIVSRSVDEVTIQGDWLLQPREAAFVRLFHSEQKSGDGRTISILKENVVSTLGQYSFTAAMTIETAPAGAWTGKLVTGATRGSADVLEAGKPIELRSAPPMSWGAPKDGLRGAVRIMGDLRTGKEAKAELWVHNSSSETVKFSWTHHADVGLAIVPTDGSGHGREAHMTRGKTQFSLHLLALTPGQAVKLKEFTLRLGSPPTDGPIGIVSLELRPGDWTLQAKWTGTLHIIEAAKEWRGELKTGEIKLKMTSEGATVVEAPKKNMESPKPAAPATPALNPQGVKLLPAIEQKLKWGEPVNGLRAALVMHPVPDEPDAEDKNDIFLVVQNVTKAEVCLHASDAAPNPRQLIWRDKGVLETVTEVAKPIPVDVRLQPGEVAFFRMTRPSGKRNPGGRSTGSLIEEYIRKDPTFSLEGSMEISTAPNGAWSGKLVTGRTEGGAAIPADANVVKVPDDQYLKSGVPVDELVGEGVIWNDVQNGLSLGYRISGDEWRILGKDVKVELWVQNHGDKDVKFQDNMRPDAEFGLQVKLKDAKGKDHNSSYLPDDRPPFGFHRLLPPGHALKVKEFAISLFLPESARAAMRRDRSQAHFLGINPGAYDFHCELELPGFTATGEGGKQLTPADGEWTGKLTTRGLNIEIIAPDAPRD